MDATAFLAYWTVAFVFMCPLAMAAIVYDMRRKRDWPLVLKRMAISSLLAVAIGSLCVSRVAAIEVRDIIPAVCATLSGWEWFVWCVL